MSPKTPIGQAWDSGLLAKKDAWISYRVMQKGNTNKLVQDRIYS